MAKHRLYAFALAATASIALPTISWADTVATYNLNQAQCSGTGCGEAAGFSFGTVTLDINSAGTGATITYDLTTGAFHDPGIDASAAFALTGVSSFSVTTDSTGTPPTGTPYSWTDTTGSVGMDGTGTFPDGVICSGNLTCGTELIVTITGSGLAQSLSTGGNGGFFAAIDVYNLINTTSSTCRADGGTYNSDKGTCALTGAVGTSLATPLPGALALFGSVLFGGLGVSSWRKRRRGRSTVSVLA